MMRLSMCASISRALASAVLAALAVTTAAGPAFPKDSAPDGKALYTRYCENCHGQLSKSDVAGATLEEIKYAMTDRMCGEAGGARLTEAELAAIARSLGSKKR